MPKKKRKRSSRKAKGAAKAAPFAFARAKTPVKLVKDQDAAFQRWAKRRSEGDPLAARRRMVESLLRHRDVPPWIARMIAYDIDPKRFYWVQIYGFASSDPADVGLPGDEPILQATYVGSGETIWERVIGYASVAPIEHIEVKEIAPSVVDRPLWSNESVVTIDGDRVYGSGQMKEYRDRLKVGRPKKAGGGMTAAERRARNKSKEAAIKRKAETNKRIADLDARAKRLDKKGDHEGAAKLWADARRLQARSKRVRKVIP